MGVRTALLAGALALAVALVLVLSQSKAQQSGSNLVPADRFVAPTEQQRAVCQTGEGIPAQTGSMRVTIGTYGEPGPPLRVEYRDEGGRLVERTGLDAGWREGVVEIPLRSRRARTGLELCFRALRPARLDFAGAPDGEFARVAGRGRAQGRVAVQYLRPGEESWFGLAGRIADRFGYGRADLLGGHWTLYAAAALLLAALAAAARTLIREARP